MLFGLLGRRYSDSAHAVYGSIVAQARQPPFYLEYGVPDTVTGRLEMIILHAHLLFQRLKREDRAVGARAQEVLDLFFTDMDRNMREMGVGDLSVPKKMKKIGMAYQGRSIVYGQALEARDVTGLSAALARNVYAEATGPDGAERLARYALATLDALAPQAAADLVAAAIAWPDPAAVFPERTP